MEDSPLYCSGINVINGTYISVFIYNLLELMTTFERKLIYIQAIENP